MVDLKYVRISIRIHLLRILKESNNLPLRSNYIIWEKNTLSRSRYWNSLHRKWILYYCCSFMWNLKRKKGLQRMFPSKFLLQKPQNCDGVNLKWMNLLPWSKLHRRETFGLLSHIIPILKTIFIHIITYLDVSCLILFFSHFFLKVTPPQLPPHFFKFQGTAPVEAPGSPVLGPGHRPPRCASDWWVVVAEAAPSADNSQHGHGLLGAEIGGRGLGGWYPPGN